MSMRIHQLATHLGPEEAFTLIEFLDQLRDLLMDTYGDDIGVMLRQASAPPTSTGIDGDGDEEEF
jgi:hypothetical protein